MDTEASSLSSTTIHLVPTSPAPPRVRTCLALCARTHGTAQHEDQHDGHAAADADRRRVSAPPRSQRRLGQVPPTVAIHAHLGLRAVAALEQRAPETVFTIRIDAARGIFGA